MHAAAIEMPDLNVVFPNGQVDDLCLAVIIGNRKKRRSGHKDICLIQSWMLHPITTTPGLSKTTGFADTPLYKGISNFFASEKE
jgi:hypothetical protein